MISFVDSLVTQFDLPLVIHMMDDWPSVPEHEGLLSPLTKRAIDRGLRRLLERQLQHGHQPIHVRRIRGEVRTRVPAVPQRAGRSVVDCFPSRRLERAGPFRLVYAGRVGKANEMALRDVAAVVAKLAEKGLPVRLEIYTLDRAPFPPGTWPDSRAIKLLPAIAYSDIPGLLVGADLLVLPLDFSVKDLAYARYSMPTKVAEYLGSGTPMLVYSPEDSAVTRYARSAGFGAIVGTRDRDALSRAIVRLVADEGERERLGRIALSVAQADQDPSRVRADFARALLDASRARPRRRRVR